MERRMFLRNLAALAGTAPHASYAVRVGPLQAAGAGDGSFNVLDFGAAGDGGADDTAAFQRAVDRAGDAGGGRVVVPHRPAGYRVAGLRMRSYVELVGIGSQAWLRNPTDKDTIVCDGRAVPGDGVIRKTRIANLLLRGSARSGAGIAYVEHADNVVERVRIRDHGGDGISGRKKPGGAKNDGLVVDNVWIDANRGAGLRLGPNSHYCQVRGASRLSNNDGGNIRCEGVAFSMFGGVVGASRSGASVVLENAHGGGFFGTEFEATPAQTVAGALLRLGTARGGRAFALAVDSCVFTASGNPEPVTLIDVENAEYVSIRGGFLDANSTAGIVGIRIGAGSRKIVLDNVGFGGNVGPGGFREIEDPGHGATIRPA